MEWTEAITEAISYIEKHITEDITMYDVADHVNASPFYYNVFMVNTPYSQ